MQHRSIEFRSTVKSSSCRFIDLLADSFFPCTKLFLCPIYYAVKSSCKQTTGFTENENETHAYLVFAVVSYCGFVLSLWWSYASIRVRFHCRLLLLPDGVKWWTTFGHFQTPRTSFLSVTCSALPPPELEESEHVSQAHITSVTPQRVRMSVAPPVTMRVFCIYSWW